MPHIIDTIIDQKIGFGKAQCLTFFFICLIEANDGIQAIVSSLTIGILQKQWNLSQSQSSSIASSFFVGAIFGSIISGKFSDFYGRKPSVFLGSILQIFSASIIIFVHSFAALVIARALYGFTYGFTLAQTTSYITQIFPSKFRGKALIFLNFNASLGKIYGLIICSFYFVDFETGNWKMMILMGCTPNLIVFVASITILRETPRYLLAVQRYQELHQVLNQMAVKNKTILQGEELLTERQKQMLVENHQQVYSGQQRAQFKSLFNNNYLRTTVCLCSIWFCTSFMYFGHLIALPYQFGNQKKTLWSYAFSVAGEIPTIFITFLIIDKPSFGRKRSLCYAFIGSGIFHLLFAVQPIVIISIFTRFFMKMIFQIVFPCTAESYGTLNRSLGYGLASAMGKVGGTVMPYVILPVVKLSVSAASIIFLITSIMGLLSAYMLPHQTLGKVLDLNQQTYIEEEEDSQ